MPTEEQKRQVRSGIAAANMARSVQEGMTPSVRDPRAPATPVRNEIVDFFTTPSKGPQAAPATVTATPNRVIQGQSAPVVAPKTPVPIAAPAAPIANSSARLFEGGPAAAFSRTLTPGGVRYADNQGNFMEGKGTGGGTFSVNRGPGQGGMSNAEWDALPNDEKIKRNVASYEDQTTALRDLRRVKTNIADGFAPDAVRSKDGGVIGDVSPQEAMKDYLSGNVRSSGYEMVRRLRKDAQETTGKGRNQRATAGAEAAGGMLASLAAPQTDTRDVLGTLNYQRGIQKDQEDRQQNDFDNRVSLANLARQDEAAVQNRSDKLQERYDKQIETLIPELSTKINWLGDSAGSYLRQAVDNNLASPTQAMNILIGTEKAVAANTDPMDPLFELAGQKVTGAQAVDILNGGTPFTSWGIGPDEEFYKAARERAAQEIQAMALQELAP
jgi:hypothetical protein